MTIGRHGLDAAFCGIKAGPADSVAAVVVGWNVGSIVRIVRAPEAVIVNAASNEMAPSEVIPAETSEVISADTGDATSTEATAVVSTEAAHMAATEAPDVTAAEAAHMAATKAATVSAATAAAAGLRAGGNKAAGKQRSCQNHYQSSSHDILRLGWAGVPPQDFRHMPARFSETNAGVAMVWRWKLLFDLSTKFSFNINRTRTTGERDRPTARRQTGAVRTLRRAPRDPWQMCQSRIISAGQPSLSELEASSVAPVIVAAGT
jgi:hypothetical protein